MKYKNIKTPKSKITVFRIIYPEKSEPYVQIKNTRTGKTEEIRLSSFIALIVMEATLLPE